MKLRTLTLALPLTVLTGCANAIDVGPSAPVATAMSAWTVYQSASPSPAISAARTPDTEASGTFLPWRPGSAAVTYHPSVVPPGATVRLTISRSGYGSEVTLTTTGLIPRRAYGAHLHTRPCTAVPEEAGPHYQNHKDPVSPSVNPVYANPQNEVWLDFTADASGAGSSTGVHGWNFDPAAPPRSLVLHAEHTHTAPGEAGKAGDRVACLTLPA